MASKLNPSPMIIQRGGGQAHPMYGTAHVRGRGSPAVSCKGSSLQHLLD